MNRIKWKDLLFKTVDATAIKTIISWGEQKRKCDVDNKRQIALLQCR